MALFDGLNCNILDKSEKLHTRVADQIIYYHGRKIIDADTAKLTYKTIGLDSG